VITLNHKWGSDLARVVKSKKPLFMENHSKNAKPNKMPVKLISWIVITAFLLWWFDSILWASVVSAVIGILIVVAIVKEEQATHTSKLK
jgi:F0F1-type ATP synthase assembly protein I